jgi:predicted membrane protein
MNAIQPLESRKSRRQEDNTRAIYQKKETERLKKQRRSHNLELALEISTKIIINTSLSVIAFVALTKLLPYHASQQEKLAVIKQELEATEVRVAKLRENFAGNFDPRQTKRVMQRNSHRVDPNQRPVFLINNK